MEDQLSYLKTTEVDGLILSAAPENEDDIGLVFTNLIEEMKRLYLRDDLEWTIMFSSGKDSTLVLVLVWFMLLALLPEQRTKRVHVVSVDTLVETPVMTVFLRQTLEAIEEEAKKQGLPILTHLSTPSMKNRFFLRC